MNRSELMEGEINGEIGCYGKRDLVLVEGKDATVVDSEGRRYVDCVAGIGVMNVGHGNEGVVGAVRDQLSRLVCCPEIFYHELRGRLFQELERVSPSGISRFFLCNSGAESVEGALKIARFHSENKRVLCFVNGFHGRTYGSLSATFNRKYRKGFEPLLDGFVHIPFNNVSRFEEEIDGVGIVLLELIQGEGGMATASQEFVDCVQRLCAEKGKILIVDEVQTGFGRTGKMFACEWYGLEPDIICMAKAMGSGLPIGGIGVREGLELSLGLHSSTFGGNPLCCAAALATIGVLEGEGLVENADVVGRYFVELIRERNHPLVRGVLGRGLMVGVEVRVSSGGIVRGLQEEGVLAIRSGRSVVRFLPPLSISKEDVDKVVGVLFSVLDRKVDRMMIERMEVEKDGSMS